MNTFAVQLLPRESTHELAEVVLRLAARLGMVCKHLEVLDFMEIGVNRYGRFQSDLPQVRELLDELFTKGRAVIGTGPRGNYVLRVKDKSASIPHSTMQVLPRLPKSYRGTASPLWEEQFPKARQVSAS